jgi:hypothetical protein
MQFRFTMFLCFLISFIRIHTPFVLSSLSVLTMAHWVGLQAGWVLIWARKPTPQYRCSRRSKPNYKLFTGHCCPYCEAHWIRGETCKHREPYGSVSRCTQQLRPSSRERMPGLPERMLFLLSRPCRLLAVAEWQPCCAGRIGTCSPASEASRSSV